MCSLLRLCASLTGDASGRIMLKWLQRIYRNWEHEFDFNPKEYVTPASLDEIVAVVKRAVAEKRTIKVRLGVALL